MAGPFARAFAAPRHKAKSTCTFRPWRKWARAPETSTRSQLARLLVKSVRLGDGTEVTGQEILHGQHALPIAKCQRDLRGLIVGSNAISRLREMVVQEVENLRQPSCLGR